MANKIALVDASPADETEFRTLLSQVGARLPQRWEASAVGDADLVLVDVDSVFGHMTWLKVLNLGKAAAVFTEHAAPKETELVLRKPLSAQGLIELLSHYHGSAPPVPEPVREPVREPARAPAPTPVPPPVDRAAPAPVAAPTRPTPIAPPVLRAAPVAAPAPAPVLAPPPVAAVPAPAPVPVAPPRDLTLIDFLTGSQLTGPVRLTTDGAPDLILDPKGQNYHVAGTGLRALIPHCGRKLKVEDFQPITAADLDKARAAVPAQPYSRLLWFCTLNASNGQLLPDLDASAKYKLNRWPQIEREFAKHFRIATVMMKQLATLTEVAEGASSPLPDVIDFVNAYYAIGFIDTDMVKPGDAAADAKGGMLSRLRNPFGR